MGEEGTYHPRNCKVFKWQDFNGYGFNLHAERGKAGQYIGKVDADSPAEKAGLKQGDRIVEVDGMNIGNENHQQVVSRIKAGGDRTSLLVVDSETDKYFKDQRVVVKGDMPEVLQLSSGANRTDTNEETGENGEVNGVTSAAIEQNGTRNNEIDLDSDVEESKPEVTEERIETAAVETVQSAPVDDEVPDSNVAEFSIPPPPIEDPDTENHEREPSPEPVHDTSVDSLRDEIPVRDPSPDPVRYPSPEPLRDPTPEPPREPTPELVRDPSPEPVRAPTPEPVRAPTPEPVRVPTPEPVRAPTPEPVRPTSTELPAQTNGAQTNGDPIMRMSAKEMREQLAAKKKADAKSKKIGFKDKYEIFQRL